MVIDATTAQHPSGFVATLGTGTLALAEGSSVTTVPWRVNDNQGAMEFDLRGTNSKIQARVLAWAACFGLPIVLEQAPTAGGEALALTWDHVGKRTLLVEGAVSLGELKETKTGRSRSVLLAGRRGRP